MRHSTYHRILRVSIASLAVALIFESGILNVATSRMAQNTHQYLANAIGISASVKSTELNQYTAKLTQIERDLINREAAITERELALGLSEGASDNQKVTYILASILFILLILILLNYTLDYLRYRENYVAKSV